MENQHLTYFKVENFKKFDSLEVKDIGQFNLIVGDNNVGKTCLLESLLFTTENSYNELAYSIISTLFKRNILLKKDYLNKINISLIKKSIIKNRELEFIFYSFYPEFDEDFGENFEEISNYGIGDSDKAIFIKNNNEFYQDKINKLDNIVSFESLFNINKRFIENFNFPFIAFNSIFEEDIYQLYNDLKTKRDKENLINTIQVVDSNIIDVELRQNFDDLESVFLLSFKNKDEFVPLNYLGDGFKRIFYIILKVLSLRGKRIMIDEIETGIHHSRQKDFLKNIMIVCKELEVQLFATTHSEECIKAFYEASIELEQEENIRLISLEKGKNEKIYATTNRFENIKAGIVSNVEFRK